MTEDATVDVRKEITAAAGVAVGNVTKVKQLVGIGDPELLKALRSSGEFDPPGLEMEHGITRSADRGAEDLPSRGRR